MNINYLWADTITTLDDNIFEVTSVNIIVNNPFWILPNQNSGEEELAIGGKWSLRKKKILINRSQQSLRRMTYKYFPALTSYLKSSGLKWEIEIQSWISSEDSTVVREMIFLKTTPDVVACIKLLWATEVKSIDAFGFRD